MRNRLSSRRPLTNAATAEIFRNTSNEVKISASIDSSRAKAANHQVCRSAYSRLPMAQSKIEARHLLLAASATSPRESFGFSSAALPKPCTAGSSVRSSTRAANRLHRSNYAPSFAALVSLSCGVSQGLAVC